METLTRGGRTVQGAVLIFALTEGLTLNELYLQINDS